MKKPVELAGSYLTQAHSEKYFQADLQSSTY